jgi:hypothetical protein
VVKCFSKAGARGETGDIKINRTKINCEDYPTLCYVTLTSLDGAECL